MKPFRQKSRGLGTRLVTSILCCLLVSLTGRLQGDQAAPSTELRIFTIGHSFHAWIPEWLSQVEVETDVKGHIQVGRSYIGGSRVIVHWLVPDNKNTAKAALIAGNVDVLTMSPMLSPDPGIDDFATLGLQHNPNLRIALQEFWLPHDRLNSFGETSYGAEANALRDWKDPAPSPTDPRKGMGDPSLFNVPTPDQIEKLHAPYFARMNDYIVEENKKLGKQVIYAVPVGQAVVALRRLVAEGKIAEIPKQSDLFKDHTGHPTEVIQSLAAYCFFAVIYHRSPVGLPILPGLAKAHYSPELNSLLQQLALTAVIQNPLSGCSDLKAPATNLKATAPAALSP
jgi:hypothetical protein